MRTTSRCRRALRPALSAAVLGLTASLVTAMPAPVASAAAGERLTPSMQAEIDRVVAEVASQPRAGRRTPGALAAESAQCAVFEDQRYCLGVGWTTRSESEVQADLAQAARPTARRTRREQTGDLDAAALARRHARMSPQERADAARRELTMAARAVDKVWLLRHEVQGVRVPAGVAARVEARNAAEARGKTAADYPDRFSILKPRQARQQNRYYWCGPASMQTIVWGWRDRRQNQKVWAKRLNTSRAGTAITDMVRVVNNNTGWDRRKHAGTYITLDISDFTFDEWFLLMMRHFKDYKAPVVLHPVLEKRFYPYLDDDASGHFQVGRGYRKTAGTEPLIGYLEPWNQQRFDPSEPFIERKQWQSAYQQYRANQAHFQHNVGV